MKASELHEIDAADLAYVESDGAVSVRPDILAQRLNEILACLQDLEQRVDRHLANRWDHMVED